MDKRAPARAIGLIDWLWKHGRRIVPPSLYPLLSPIYRLRRHAQLRQQVAGDQEYVAANPGVVAPPAALRFNVVGPCSIPQFLEGGQRAVADIERALQGIGGSLSQVRDFLDFGCGCGRLLLALRGRPELRVTGCDVDQRAIAWCRDHVGAAVFAVNDALPPCPFPDKSFDLVWCGSVFTHLDEERQDRWLGDLRRILKPGGVLLASVHGPDCWAQRLPWWTIASLQKTGMMYARTAADTGVHPGWYQVAWHTEEYIRRHWGAVFAIRNYVRRGVGDYQDLVVAQVR